LEDQKIKNAASGLETSSIREDEERLQVMETIITDQMLADAEARAEKAEAQVALLNSGGAADRIAELEKQLVQKQEAEATLLEVRVTQLCSQKTGPDLDSETNPTIPS